MKRAVITFVGGVAAWSLAARAQQPKVPTIGVASPFRSRYVLAPTR